MAKNTSTALKLDMGDVELRKQRRSKNWFIRFYYNGTRLERSLKTPHQGAAVKKAIAIIGELEKGNNPFDKIDPITFKAFVVDEKGPFRRRWTKWGKNYKKSQWGTALRLATEWGNRNLHTIKRKECEEFLARLLDAGRSPATVNRYLFAMRVLFKQAKEWGYIKIDPAEGIKPLKESVNSPSYLTQEQVGTIYRLLSPEYVPVVAIAVNTGMRISEIQNLKWNDVHFDRKEIEVNQRKGRVGETIPMSPDVIKTLKPMKKKTGWVVGRKKDFRDSMRYPLERARKLAYISVARAGADDPDDPAFFQELKTDFLQTFETKLSTHLWNEAKEKGSPKDVELPHLHPHLFRHTFATWLADADSQPGAIQQLLGHSTLTMTLRYAKATDKQKNKAINSLPSDVLSDGIEDEK